MASIQKNKLESVKLFNSISDDDLRTIEKSVRFSSFQTGDQIIDRNSDNQEVFFVLKGSVRVVNFSTSGREIAFGSFEEGDFFGEISAIDGKPRSANVFAVSECELASLSPPIFHKLLIKYPIISSLVLERFAKIIRVADERIMDLSTLKVVQRVYIELLKMTDHDVAVPELWVIRPMLSHSEIASRVGTTRETVARVLGQLSEAKIVEKKPKALYIRNKEKLEQLAAAASPEGMISPKN